MTDYTQTFKRPLWKRAAIWLFEKPWINAPLVNFLKSIRAPVWRDRLPVMSGMSQVILPRATGITMLAPERCNVARETWWHDGELAEIADRNALALAIDLACDADLFLDIGSYTGLFALAVARNVPSIHCHAFEIVPENFLLLWKNVIHNDLIGRITVRLEGAGDMQGKIRVPIDLEAGVLPSSVALDSNTQRGVVVPVSRVDDMITARGVKLVIKIDVEGYEWNVLSGATELTEDCLPDIICEFLTRAPDILVISNHLRALGLSLIHI